MILKPSLRKILTIDYIAFMGMLMLLFPIAFYLFGGFSGKPPAEQFPWLAAFTGLLLVSLGVVIYRVYLIHTIFADGWETQAVIRSIWFQKDRGRVEYTYKYLDIEYKSGSAVMKAHATQSLRVGDTVTVLVDRSRPQRAFLRDLYMGQPAANIAPPSWQDEPGIRISFQGTYDRATFLRAFMLVYRPSRREALVRFGLVVLAVLLFAAFVYFYGSRDFQWRAFEWNWHATRAVLAVAGLLAAVFEPLIYAYITAHLRWKKLPSQGPIAGEIDHNGIQYTHPTSSRRFVPWTKIVKGRIDMHRKLVVLVSNEGEVHAFPASYFETGILWSLAAFLARKHVRQAPYTVNH